MCDAEEAKDPAAAFHAGESSLTDDEAAIEAGVRRAVESVFGAEALDAEALFTEPLPFGKVNRVYKVRAGRGPAFVVKVFAYAGWPEDGKPEWLEEQLTRASVPHARLLYCSRRAEHFPNGFAVYEHVGGRNCVALMREGALAAHDFCRLAGKYLRAVHSIRLERYGYIGTGGAGTDEDYVECKLTYDVSDRLREMGELVHARLFPVIEEKVERLLRPLEGRFTPRLLHGDLFPRNGLLKGDGGLVFVDWDEALSGIWPEDLARLSYWFAYPNPSRGGDAMPCEQVAESFLGGYGASEFDRQELARIVRALHIVYSADLLSYQHKTNNTASMGRTKNVLESLLSL